MSAKPSSFDDENPEWTAEDFRRAKPASDLPSDVLAAFPNTVVPQADSIAVPISRDIVRHFEAKGPGWEKRIDALLRNAIQDEQTAA